MPSWINGLRAVPRSPERGGAGPADWVLIDFGDVVVHVFQEQARGLYDIEGLWLDAARLPLPGGAAAE